MFIISKQKDDLYNLHLLHSCYRNLGTLINWPLMVSKYATWITGILLMFNVLIYCYGEAAIINSCSEWWRCLPQRSTLLHLLMETEQTCSRAAVSSSYCTTDPNPKSKSTLYVVQIGLCYYFALKKHSLHLLMDLASFNWEGYSLHYNKRMCVC